MIRSVIYNWAGLLVAGLISFLLTPVLIRSLGPYYYGLWMLVGSLTDYYGLLDAGIRVTLQRFVARQSGTNERDALNDTFSTAMVLTVLVFIAVAVVASALAFVLPRFFALNGPNQQVFQALMLLFGLNVGLTLIARLCGAYLCGIHRFDLYNIAGMLTALVRAALLVAVLWRGKGVIAVAVVTVVVAAASLLLHALLLLQADPQLRFSLRSTSLKRMKELVGFSFYIFLTTVGDYLRGYTDSLVIGRWIGITAITPFSVVVRLMEYFKQLMTAVIGPVMPAISQLDAQQREAEVRNLFLRATRITAIISLLVGAEFILNGKGLLKFWLGEGFTGVFPLLVVMTVGYVINFSQSPAVVLLIAKGRHRDLGWWSLAEGVANLLLSIYWATRYGLIGVAWGTVVPMVLNKLLVQPLLVARHSTIRIPEYLLNGFGRPAFAFSIFLAFAWLSRAFFNADSAPIFVVKCFWDATLFLVIAYWAGLHSEDRQRFMARLFPVRSAAA
jgi:O-antigen/teichoic acid export membrane protein